MKHIRLCIAFLLSVSVTPAAVLAQSRAQPLAPGRYCMVEPLVGNTGTEEIPLGNFMMEVRVRRTRAGHAVSFWNVMPDSPQILQAETQRALVQRDGSLTFTFVDGWNNRGRARVRRDGRVELTVTRQAPDNQIGRNYGSYRVSRAACSHPEFAANR